MEEYKKIKLIGRGAYGTVYLYQRVLDGNNVVIKEIPVDQMSKDDRQAALNEAKVLSMLDHPNIVAYHENFLRDKMMLIVMEYAEGGMLYDYLEERKGNMLTEEEVLRFFSQLVLALQHVHSRSILHRDLKSQNILLNKDKTVLKIGDFGISKILSSKSRAVTVVGTPYYISPELCEGRPYNQKSDIWALGCILYELLTLKRPFESDNLPALVMRIMKGSFDPVPDKYSWHLRQLVMNMLHIDPNKRPNANQIMAQPFMVNTLYQMYMDIGCLPPNPRGGAGGGFLSNFCPTQNAENLDPGFCPSPKGCEVWHVKVDSRSPIMLSLPSDNCRIKHVSLGLRHMVGVTENCHIIVWKEDTRNQSGFSVEEDEFVSNIVSVGCGDDFTICLSGSGVVSSFYHNDSATKSIEPKILEALFGFNITSIACGPRHALAVSEDNDLFAWGHGNKGCLGLGKADFHALPQTVDFKQKVKTVFCGPDCSFAVTEESLLFVCGSNRHNRLALDTEEGLHIEETRVFSMVRSEPLPHSRVKSVAAGLLHTAILLDDGTVYTVGSNRQGQLGWGDTSLSHTMPSSVTGLMSPVSHVACGEFFTLALTEGGALFAWGKCPEISQKSEGCNVVKVNSLAFLKDKKIVAMNCNMSSCLIVTS